jgi:hypothetical protein
MVKLLAKCEQLNNTAVTIPIVQLFTDVFKVTEVDIFTETSSGSYILLTIIDRYTFMALL